MQSKFFWYWSNIMSSIPGPLASRSNAPLQKMTSIEDAVQIFFGVHCD